MKTKETEAGLYNSPPTPCSAHNQNRRWVIPIICFGLIAIIWVIFGRAVRYDFLNYDDSFYVYQNPSISNGLTWAGLVRAFTHPLVGNWHPLTSISLMLDAEWSGLRPSGYHLVNLILHTMAVLFGFFALRAMTGATWRSAFVAALFAVHPLRAESVVWISERKDVLSGVFFFLGLWAYSRYARKRTLESYLLLALALTLGLLSKAMLVTFPLVLLLLDYWPLQRFDWAAEDRSYEARPAKVSWLALEKIPFLLLAAAISVATAFAQEPAMRTAENWPLSWRVENALVTVWTYLRQMFWPSHLAVFYPHPKDTLQLWVVGLSLLASLAVTISVVIVRKSYPYLVTGWLWYLGMLIPVIGLIQVGAQAHADRYTYLPQIGVYLMLSWGVADLIAGWRARRFVLSAAATLVLGALMMLSWRQVGYWSSNAGLWRHTLAVTSKNDVAERGLGTALFSLGKIDEAIVHDRAALRIRPGDANALTNLAIALLRKGELPEAIVHFREVARVRPNDSEIHRDLGKALFQIGAFDKSIAEFRQALRLRPNDSDAAYSLGNVSLQKGDAAGAIPYFRQTIELRPNDLAAHYNLGIALQRTGQLDGAIAEFHETLRVDPRKVDALNNLAITQVKKGLTNEAIAEWQAALRIEPGNAEMHNNLGLAYLGQGRLDEAVAEWRATLRLQPDKLTTELTLAWILATAPEENLRHANEALEIGTRVFQSTAERNLTAYRVLAAAYAENGRFDAAIKTAQEGARRADAKGKASIAQLLQLDLSLYQQSIPLRDSTHGRNSETGR